MPDDELDELIKRARRVQRVTAEADVAESEAGVPPGFAERVLRVRDSGSASAPPAALVLWKRFSYGGFACALALALIANLTLGGGQAEPTGATVADPWMDMPMVVAVEPEGGEAQ